MTRAAPPVLVNPLQPVLTVRSAALSTIAQQTAARFLGPLDVLVAAAWLHDIGYARVALVTGFHPLDGANYLTGQLWPARITGLVAHHSGARFVATALGLEPALAAFPDERGLMSDALTYADQTVGVTGQRVTADRRRAEMLGRHGADSCNAQVDHIRGPHLRAAVARVERELQSCRKTR